MIASNKVKTFIKCVPCHPSYQKTKTLWVRDCQVLLGRIFFKKRKLRNRKEEQNEKKQKKTKWRLDKKIFPALAQARVI